MKPGIRLQLVLSLGGLFVLAFAPLFVAVASLTRATLRSERELNARALGRVVAVHVAEAQASRPTAELQRVLDAQIGPSVGIEAIAAYDDSGALVARAGEPVVPDHVSPSVDRVSPSQSAHGPALSVLVSGRKGSVVAVMRVDDHIGQGKALLRLVALYIAVVALALLLFVYASLTRTVVRPLEALSQDARRVTEGRRLLSGDGQGSRELVELRQSLAEMTRKLRDEEGALRDKVDELERARRTLEAAQQSLVRSERLATVGRLSAGLAHEVGNPLAALIGLEDLLLDGGLTPEEERDFIRRMRSETERIHRIMRDLLAYARPAAPRTDEQTDPGDVAPAIDDAVGLLRPQKGLRDIDFKVSIAPGLPLVSLGRDRLVQVLVNLLSNAVDALAGKGSLSLTATLDNDRVLLVVQDDGPGIDPAIASQLFEPFVTTKDVGQGTGLGLAVCKGLVEGAGGTIDLEPLPEGQRGARFVVRLPRAGDR